MLTSKQRAYLRSIANGLDTIFHVGKSGITPEFVAGIGDALEVREIIKINLLDNCMLDTRSTAQTVAERTRSEVVQVIGKKFVLYKAAKKPIIELPKK